jgi:hypothetical protein
VSPAAAMAQRHMGMRVVFLISLITALEETSHTPGICDRRL